MLTIRRCDAKTATPPQKTMRVTDMAALPAGIYMQRFDNYLWLIVFDKPASGNDAAKPIVVWEGFEGKIGIGNPTATAWCNSEILNVSDEYELILDVCKKP